MDRSIHKYFHRHITEWTLWKFADRFGKINVFDTAYLAGFKILLNCTNWWIFKTEKDGDLFMKTSSGCYMEHSDPRIILQENNINFQAGGVISELLDNY